MPNKDVTETDKRLIAALRNDSRTSVTMLANCLGLSRATVQNRLDRLVKSGIIKKFTIEVDSCVDSGAVKAVSMIQTDGMRTSEILTALGKIPEIAELHTTNGTWALIAHIEASSLTDFDRILREMRTIKGLVNSETSILLNRAGS